MKRFFVLPLILLLLCGCTKTKQVEPILNNISFTAQIEYGDDNFVCDTTLADNALNLIVVEPSEIGGLTLSFTKDSAQAEFNGITFNPDLDSIPQGAIAKVLLAVLNDVKAKTITCVDKNCEITSKVDDYKYKFIFSPSGLPILLEIDNLDLKINFNNVVVK